MIPEKSKIEDRRVKNEENIEKKREKREENQEKKREKREKMEESLEKKREKREEKEKMKEEKMEEDEPVKRTTQSSNEIAFLSRADNEALSLIEKMDQAYLEDIKAFKNKRMAFRKVKMLNTISQHLQNVLVRRCFLEREGLNMMTAWMSPVQDSGDRWVEPSMAVKMGLLRIVDHLKLSSWQISKFGTQLHGLIYKNMMQSKIGELKEACKMVLKGWDYMIYKQCGQESHKK